MRSAFSRRAFLGSAIAGMGMAAAAQEKPIQGFDDTQTNVDKSTAWQPVSDRKVRVGIVGYGVCKFGAAFDFQNHPNVEIVAVSDLIPERCAELAQQCRCAKTYPSLDELVKDPAIEAVFVATDAPSHPKHCIEVLKHGKHVASAVPAVFGSLEDADALYAAVKSSGLNYMMMETSSFHDDCYAMRQIYNADGFGKMVYSEGEYYHLHGTADRFVQRLADRVAAAVVPDAFERVLHVRDGREFYRGFVHGPSEPDRASEAGEQRVQKPVWHGDRFVPDERRRDGADGGELGFAWVQRGDGQGARTKRHAVREVRRIGGRFGAQFSEAAVGAGDVGGRAWRVARVFEQRVHHVDPAGPGAAGEHRVGVEHDGGGYCGAPVGDEGRGVFEDTAVYVLIADFRLPIFDC